MLMLYLHPETILKSMVAPNSPVLLENMSEVGLPSSQLATIQDLIKDTVFAVVLLDICMDLLDT